MPIEIESQLQLSTLRGMWDRYFGTDILGWDILAQIFLQIFYFGTDISIYHRKIRDHREFDHTKSEICHRGVVL